MSDTHDVLSSQVPSLDDLELLLEIARTGSLTRAGTQHGITQSAVSLRLRRLERQVGVLLVERSATGSRLTEAGALVASWARDVVQAAEHLEASLATLRQRDGEHLRVAASMTVAEQLLPAWLARLHRSDPGTSVALTAVNSSVVAELVLSRQVDLGFVEGPALPPGLTSRTVGTDELLLVCAPTDPLARRRRRPVTAEELAAVPLVEREAGSGTRAALDAAVGGTARPAPLLEVSSTTAVLSTTASGLGPAVLSSLAVRDLLAAGRLVAVPTTGIDLRRQLRAVWPRGTTLLGPVRRLLEVARS